VNSNIAKMDCAGPISSTTIDRLRLVAIGIAPAANFGIADCQSILGALTLPSIETLARALNEVLGSADADDLMLHPAANSWDGPNYPRWRQWEEAAEAVLFLFPASQSAPATTPPPPNGEGEQSEPTEHKASEQMIAELCEALTEADRELEALGSVTVRKRISSVLARAKAQGAAR
jgi:hypothetical protein